MMTKSGLTEKLKELNSYDNFICSDVELNDYINFGLLVQSNDNTYYTRTGKKLNIDVVKSKNMKFNINLSYMLNLDGNFKKVYCMTKNTYEDYKNRNLIVEKSNKEYFRFFDDELWEIIII